MAKHSANEEELERELAALKKREAGSAYADPEPHYTDWKELDEKDARESAKRVERLLAKKEEPGKALTVREELYPAETAKPVSGEIKHPEVATEKKKSKAGRTFVRACEVLAIVGSFVASSRIARFVVAKLSGDVLVEVTARFGRQAGHTLSTINAAIIAEPRIIAAVVTGIILIINAFVWTGRGIRHGLRRRREKKHGKERE